MSSDRLFGPKCLLAKRKSSSHMLLHLFSYPSFTQPHKLGRTFIPIIPTGWFPLVPSQICYVVFRRTSTLPTRRKVSIAVYIAANHSPCPSYRHAGLINSRQLYLMSRNPLETRLSKLPSSNRPPYWLEHCGFGLLTLQRGTVPSPRYMLLLLLF